MASIHEVIPFWTVVPFVGILLSIALCPLLFPAFWHRHYGKLAATFALPVGYYVLLTNWHWLTHTAVEYVSFIALLGALFVISGGVYIRGSLSGRPIVNAIIFLIGAVIANFVGTTGASMLLIRPLLRANSDRPYSHFPVIFFIFLVSNMGGLLTPLGDPPLYLGFLKGVPFFWTLRLLPIWCVGVGVVLGIYVMWDSWLLRNHVFKPKARPDPFMIYGSINFLFLAGVLAVVIGYGQMPQTWGIGRDIFQVLAMGFCAMLSIVVTPQKIRFRNRFTYAPIKEVAILFAGIFTCMIPALKLLEQQGASFGILEPWQFFWCTGALSSFLDNAPTYLAFLSLAKTVPSTAGPMVTLLSEGAVNAVLLQAVSVGAVFMGAMTYIGNGPNFMVKAIAEGYGYQMPSFLGYMGYSMVVLIPMLVLVQVIFFL